ncbi:DNA polymerase III subunit alpha [Solitalea sp. MAHUQ-68]|uniref:DNA-directed DNA polymerase n=1 Tax=Solitalea agri TaxID=2953739 RepID=A0A9X2F546_9SPHI|nr:DNA polymerase III subunit alpha [Solitalea agri]MCO4294305.1 DNA polymerase III subunit alpha [Solitalea agri]
MYLNCHSWYSLRYGTLAIERLIELAKANHVECLTLTDINNSTGSWEFVKECTEAAIKPLVGIEFRREGQLLYIGIARNNEGFRELNEFLTRYNLSKTALPDQPDEFANVYVVYPFNSQLEHSLKDNEFIGVRSTELNRLFGRPLQYLRDKLVVLHPVTFENKQGRFLHAHLRAIDFNTLFSKLQKEDVALEGEYMLPVNELRKQFEAYPFILENTKKLMDSCAVEFDLKESKNKKLFTESAYQDKELLRKHAYEGMQYRYGNNNQQAKDRIEKELTIINNQGFAAYFLITHDMISYTRSRGFYHVGRGSGANSIVAYCMQITDVDPLDLDLYFERFLNPKRSVPPDFDIDYSWNQRDAVHEYLFTKYGKEHTALLGTMSTFQRSASIRELGKVYGLPKEEIDEFADFPQKVWNRNDLTKKIKRLADAMHNMPNQRSIHAGGVLISEKPLTYYTALDLPPKGLPTVQWDMYAAETINFEKYDILSQRGIGHIKEAVDIVRQNRGINIDIHDIPKLKNDPVVRQQLKTGDSIGCFYIESPAMRGLLKKLHCDDYLTLVAASSIIRPGVAKSGMMRQYIQRYHHPEKIEYLHPVMKEQLEETYGVMVYQEDVLKVCHHYAGLNLADADVLRRAMSGKYRSKAEFERIVQRFFEGSKELNRPEAITNEVWRQVESFAGYSFSKAHSASYAVESFQSLYLKTYYPKEFMVAVINNFGGFYRTWVYVHEALKAGCVILNPCVNESNLYTCIKGADVYLGFIHIANLESSFSSTIINERQTGGPYLDLEDFVHRTQITIEQVLLLIRLNAFRFTGKTKKELLWEVYNYLGHQKVKKEEVKLFNPPAKKYNLPELEHSILEDAFDEIELLGFPVSVDHFTMLQTRYRGDVFTKDLVQHVGRTVKMVGNFVAYKPVKTVKGEMMYFGTFFDVNGDFFDTTHFPNTTPEMPFRGGGCYLILGKVVEEFGFPSLEIEKFAKLPTVKDPRY